MNCNLKPTTMIKDIRPLLGKDCPVPNKTNRSFSFCLSAFLFLVILALTASAFAQTVDYNLPKNWLCHPILKSTDVAREQNLSLTVQNPDLSIDTVINYTHSADSLVDIF